MPVLILNAGTASPITLLVQSAGENAPTEIGSVTQSFQGADRSSVRATKRNYGSLSTYVSTAVKDSIIDLLKSGRQLPCSGDLVGGIQKQCTVRYTGATMSPQIVDMWTVGLTASEVQPNNILLRYTPGDTITGESFTRSTIAEFQGGSGAMGSAAINVKRDSHFIGGLAPRSMLLEGVGTNSILRASDFVNAAWTKTNLTATNATADPAGGTTACTLTATGASAQAFQILATGSSIVRTNTCWIRRRTGTGTVSLCDPNDTPQAVTLTSSWARFTRTGSASINRIFDIVIATSGDAIDVWMPQLEDATQPSSEIATTTVAVTRGADAYSFPYTTPPQELSAYVKFVELGTAFPVGRLFSITSAANGAPQFACFGLAGLYTAHHNNGTATVTSASAVSVAVGNIVELVLHLYGDGSVDITQSINGGASTTSTQSAANPLAAAWADLLVWLNSGGSSGQVGYAAFQSFKIVAGARSLSEMRNL